MGVVSLVGAATTAPSHAQNADKQTSGIFRNADDIPNLIFDANQDKESRTGPRDPGGFLDEWNKL